MDIKHLILNALESGAAKRDDKGYVSFDLLGLSHSVRVTDEDIKTYEAKLAAELEQAELDYADAESLMSSAKAKIAAAEARNQKRNKAA